MRCFYSPDYFHELPVGHPFPMAKFPEAHALLGGAISAGLIEVFNVDEARRVMIERVHQSEYLEKVCRGSLSSREATQLGLPPSLALYRRSAREVEGTRRAAWAALEYGIAANLAGGTHHAFPDHGEGFCVLNDVAITIRDLHANHPEMRVFVADTDAHQGNGTNAIFAGDPRVFTFSIHVGRNYPSRKVAGSLDVPLERYTDGGEYMRQLTDTLPLALDQFQPDLVIWISGADPHRNDRFGQLQLSAAEMTHRDNQVIGWSLERLLPTVVLYGGGYNREVGHTARLHRNTVIQAARIARRFGK